MSDTIGSKAKLHLDRMPYVCMDVVCACGEYFHQCTHRDGTSSEYLRCPHCSKVLRCGAEVDLCEVPINYRLERPTPKASYQWKGTHACMTASCKCGHAFPIERDFAHEETCPACRQHYFVDPHILVTEVAESDVPVGAVIQTPEKDLEFADEQT